MTTSDLPELLPAIILQVGSASVAIDPNDVQKCLELETIRPLPQAPRALRGIALVEGEPVFVIDLSRLSLEGEPRVEGDETSVSSSGVLCRVDGESVLVTGGQIRSVGRVRVSELPVPRTTELSELSAEWRGAAVPVLSIPSVLAAATKRSV